MMNKLAVHRRRSKLYGKIISSKISMSSKNIEETSRTDTYSLNSDVVRTDLKEIRRKVYSLRCLQLKFCKMSPETSKKTKTKGQKRIHDEDSGFFRQFHFFDNTDEPQLINDRSALIAKNLHQLNVWRRVYSSENQEESQHSGTDDPVEEWNNTVINWRTATSPNDTSKKKLKPDKSRAKMNSSFIKQTKLSSFTDLEPLEQQPSTSTDDQLLKKESEFFGPREDKKSFLFGNDLKEPTIVQSADERVDAEMNLVKNVIVCCELDANDEMLQLIYDIECKWEQKFGLTTKQISNSDEDEDRPYVIEIL